MGGGVTRDLSSFCVMSSAPRPKLVLLGDSITQQSFSLERSGWGAALADHFQQKLDVINRGASGYNTRWTLPLLAQLFPSNEHAPLVVLIFFGANDACAPSLPGSLSLQHVPVDEYEQNLVKIVKFIKGIGCNHVFIGMAYSLREMRIDIISFFSFSSSC